MAQSHLREMGVLQEILAELKGRWVPSLSLSSLCMVCERVCLCVRMDFCVLLCAVSHRRIRVAVRQQLHCRILAGSPRTFFPSLHCIRACANTCSVHSRQFCVQRILLDEKIARAAEIAGAVLLTRTEVIVRFFLPLELAYSILRHNGLSSEKNLFYPERVFQSREQAVAGELYS